MTFHNQVNHNEGTSFFQFVSDGAQPGVRDVVRGGEGHHPARGAAPARDPQAQPHPGTPQVTGTKGAAIIIDEYTLGTTNFKKVA